VTHDTIIAKRITAVCGISRSGTSLMMKMLHKGGIQPFCDDDQSYEHPLVLSLPDNGEWLGFCIDKCVKLLEPQQFSPPRNFPYNFIWMDRDSREQVKSQQKFMRALGGFHIPDSQLKRLAKGIDGDRPVIVEMLKSYQDARVLRIRFEALIRKPQRIAEIVNEFLGGGLDVEAMAKCVMPREPECLPYVLEAVQEANASK
jgi:hypothetical protein